MNEQQIRDRIKALQAEIKQLRAQLPKPKRQPTPKHDPSAFLRMANKMMNSERKA